MRRSHSAAVLALVSLPIVACGSGTTAGADAADAPWMGMDARASDGATDAAFEAAADAPRDAVDVSIDARPDVAADGNRETGIDVSDAMAGGDALDVTDTSVVDAGFGSQRNGARFVRIRTIDVEQGRGWALSRPYAYDAQQVLAMVQHLRPSVLERYISGNVPPTMAVPVASSAPATTALDFLSASENVEACNRVITPRVSCNEYDLGTLYQTTRALLDMPIRPHPMRFLSLDNWVGWIQSHTRAEAVDMFNRLYAQGWEEVGINDCGFGGGGTVDQLNGFGLATFAEACVDTTTWQPNTEVAALRASSNIRLVLLYIDFPGQMMAFESLSPDRQADVLTSLTSHQASGGYTFVYEVLQEIPSDVIWDATRVFTSTTGPYGGASIYEVMHGLMDRYNPVTVCP